VVRWAWRLFRKDWRQQIMLLALVTVAVATAVAGASMAVNAASAKKGELGDAGAVIELDVKDADSARASVAAATERFGPVEVIRHASASVPGSARPLDVRAQSPHGLYSSPMLALRKGRYPDKAGEVALTRGAAALLSARLGQRVALGGVDRTVVGEVENPSDLNDDFALVSADDPAPADTLLVLIRSADRNPVGPDTFSGQSFRIRIINDDKAAVAAAVLVATTLAMLLVCLIAAAGFVVVAQRRQRQLGMLSAIGATPRHLRLVMLANGALVGVAAAVIGGALGILSWVAAAPAVEKAAGHRIGRLDLPWALITECLAIAVIVATAAAWWPARTASRLPVMTALSGRPARPRPVHRSVALALVLVGAGTGAIAAARPTANVRPLVLMAGIVAAVVGVVFASPAAVRALAAPARRLPFSARLALRDLVRYQARAASALAAITLVLGISVATVVLAKVGDYRSDEGNLSPRQLLVRADGQPAAPDPRNPADPTRLDDAAARIDAILGGAALYPLDVAVNTAVVSNDGHRGPVLVATPIDHGFRGAGQAFVATPQLLQRYGIDPATIDGATDLLTSLPGSPVLLDTTKRPSPDEPATVVQRVQLSTYTSAPTSLVTESALRRHGWVAVRVGWLAESSKPLTAEQITAARQAAAAAGLTIETRSSQDGLATLRTVATTVGGLLALALVGMTIGLIRGEAAADLRTLTATGAPSRIRRALAASTAGALSLLGVVLSTAGAYIALVAAYHADLGKLAAPPLGHLLTLAIGLPTVAMTAAWLLAGREPRTFARQALV
jgi:putative ABC transport system permease protein